MKRRLKKNLNLLGGLHKSQNILLALMQKGLLRQKAYSIVQKCAMDTWNNKKQFEEIILKNKEIRNYLNDNELKDIFKKNENFENLNLIYENKFKWALFLLKYELFVKYDYDSKTNRNVN